MADTITENKVCEKCGADVREGTTFCYSCGAKIPEDLVAPAENDIAIGESEADALLAKAFGEAEKSEITADNGNKLSKAADERKKSRAGLRKPKQYVWEPEDNPIKLLIVALGIFAIALLVVFLTVFWK